MTDHLIYLASRSPRRSELLRQIGVKFETVKIDIDESPRHNEPAECFVRRMANEKAQAGFQLLGRQTNVAIIAADTIISIGGDIIGKPSDRVDCGETLSRLSGRTHRVLSAVSLKYGENQWCELSRNKIRFKSLDSEEIAQYCQTSEPMDKAGSYAIQGFATVFIEHMEGSYSSVMGLPLFETFQLLKQARLCH
ncbi:MAG: septum formation protein [Gammaproteobacteria bacterium]|jgi:septum formation protein